FEGAKPTTPLTAKGAKGTSPEVRGFGLTLPRVLKCASVGHHDRSARGWRVTKTKTTLFSRRTFLRGIRWAPVLFLPAPFQSAPFRLPLFETPRGRSSLLPFADFRLTPHYPAKSALDDVLLKVVPGGDEYLTEKYAFE